MHRQGQGPGPLRVRLQGVDRCPRHAAQGRPVRPAPKALHGNPFDGHTLKGAVADVERNTGVEVRRIHVNKGYRGHDYPNRFRVWISGQVRRTTATIKREMRRRAAVEPVIGHVKADHRMDPNYLKGQHGDRINAVLAAAGFNFHLLLRWLAALLRALFLAALQSLVTTRTA
jgi:IS5 family transposase